jgi:hypothetical protein
LLIAQIVYTKEICMSTTDITIYFTINGEGEFEVGTEADEAEERFASNIMTSGRVRTYAIEITDVELPDEEPTVIRVSMKGAAKAEVIEGPISVGDCWSFSKAED